MGRTGREVQLVEYPEGAVAPSHFRVAEVEVGKPAAGEVLVRNTFTSVDPGMRLRLRESGPAGYFNSFPLNAAMDGIMTVGEVVESRADGFAAVPGLLSYAQSTHSPPVAEASHTATAAASQTERFAATSQGIRVAASWVNI